MDIKINKPKNKNMKSKLILVAILFSTGVYFLRCKKETSENKENTPVIQKTTTPDYRNREDIPVNIGNPNLVWCQRLVLKWNDTDGLPCIDYLNYVNKKTNELYSTKNHLLIDVLVKEIIDGKKSAYDVFGELLTVEKINTTLEEFKKQKISYVFTQDIYYNLSTSNFESKIFAVSPSVDKIIDGLIAGDIPLFFVYF